MEARGVCGSVRGGGGENLKSVQWNEKVKPAFERKVVLGARDEVVKESIKKRERLKGAFINGKRE